MYLEYFSEIELTDIIKRSLFLYNNQISEHINYDFKLLEDFP